MTNNNKNALPKEMLTIFGTRLRDLRVNSNKTQEEMSDILGLSRSYYGNLESGHGVPSLQTLYKIVEYFDCSYDYLLHKTNIKTAYEELESNLIDLILSIDGLTFGDIEISNEEKCKIITAFTHALSILNL
jgi:transcriptional regulator with XRE-family HTH domain